MATRKLASTRQILNGDYDREIYEAMARAMFVSDWADRQEEKGKTYPGMDLMDVAPPTSRDALLAARALAAAVIKDNNVKSLTDLYARALNAGGEGDARKFGHYLAMQAMGHGVSWYDDGNPEFGLKLPHFEYYSGRGRVAQKLGHAAGDSTEQLRVRIAEALKWTVKETESFSFPQLASFVRGKDAQLDADLARHIESASHWFKPARRSRRKGLASGSKAKAKGGHMLRIYDKKDATRLVRETHHTSRARALKSRDDFERRHGRHPHAIDAADAKGLASGSKAKIPANFPVKVLRPGQRAKDKVTCGTCGRSWDDAISTSMTPTPSGRCPFEHFHKGLASGSKAKKPRLTSEQKKALDAYNFAVKQEDRYLGSVFANGPGARDHEKKVRAAYERCKKLGMTHEHGLASGRTKQKAKRTRVKASCACSATAVVRKKSKKASTRKK